MTQKDAHVEYRDRMKLKLKKYCDTYQKEANLYIERVANGIENLDDDLVKKAKSLALRSAYQIEPEIEKYRQIWLKLHYKKKKKNLLSFEQMLGMEAHISIVGYWSTIKKDPNYPKKEKETMTEEHSQEFVLNGNEETNNEKKMSFVSLYRQLAKEYKLIPPDPIMALLTKSAPNTPASTRGNLRKEGFEFEEYTVEEDSPNTINQAKYWLVTKVPEDKGKLIEEISKAISGWTRDDLNILKDLVKKGEQ